MLMQWVQLSPTAPAASTPALAAAVLQLAAQAHMVHFSVCVFFSIVCDLQSFVALALLCRSR